MALLMNATLCSPRVSAGELSDPRNPIVVESALNLDDIQPNHVVIKVDRFGFSANNISYQALGEHPHFRYFDFHPAPTLELQKTHGLVPVWGFGSVVGSKHPKIPVGERVYGYFAPTRYLVLPVSPSDVNKYAFYVLRPHLPADRRPYNQVLRCTADPMYTPGVEAENLAMLYRPLFWTSYWCEDWLHSTGCYKPSTQTQLSILVSSASSKTAFCLAYLIQKRIRSGELRGVKIVGLTSKGNAKFTERLDLYDEVYEYSTFREASTFQGAKKRQWIYIDVAGNGSLNKQLKEHFSSPAVGRIVKNVALGVTNLQPTASANDDMKWSHNAFNPKAQSIAPLEVSWATVEHFFMVEWLNVRKHHLSIQEIFLRQQNAWADLMKNCTKWVELQPVYQASKVREAYIHLAKEGLGPNKGLIWSLWDEEPSITTSAKL